MAGLGGLRRRHDRRMHARKLLEQHIDQRLRPKHGCPSDEDGAGHDDNENVDEHHVPYRNSDVAGRYLQRCTRRCLGTAVWGNGTALLGGGQSIAQFQVTASVQQPSTTVTTTPSTMSFPNANDRTQYPTWDAAKTDAPGDAYIEGSGISGQLSVIAENDIVVTGKLTAAQTTITNGSTGELTWAEGGAAALVADQNVRVYRPISCADATVSPDMADTTAGWCPNDITGLYSGLESNGTLQSTHPALQYCNLTASTTGGVGADNTGNPNAGCSSLSATGSGPVSEIDAVVFALNGSLLTDNYNRGVPMSSLTIKGGIYQLHRGATGEQWETQSADSSRASSGYLLQDDYVDVLPADLPYVPEFSGGTGGRDWNIVSISDGASS